MAALLEVENLAVRALIQIAPWLLMVLLVFSLLCALIYSRYITRPIVRMSGIAGKMAELDFHWECGEKRKDQAAAADGGARLGAGGRGPMGQPAAGGRLL